MVLIRRFLLLILISSRLITGLSLIIQYRNRLTKIHDTMQPLQALQVCARKDFFFAVTAIGFLIPKMSLAAEEWGSTPENPVAVIGAGGKTGMEVIQSLAKENLYAVSMTRTGVDPFRVVKLPAELKKYINHYPEKVDVRSLDSLKHALEKIKASAIIFCASASKQGGTAFEVDDEGVENTAKVAKELGSRLVLISALAVDRPQSKSYQITNTLGGNLKGIMDAKLSGEEKVRIILAASKNYVILRPGPLLSGKGTGRASEIELNQGDTVGGGLSRDELAAAAVGALRSGVRGVTVEIYRKSTATKLQSEFALPSGRERYGNSYLDLFESLDMDT